MPRITIYECDVFSSDKLSDFCKMLNNSFKTIDLFINNGVTFPESIRYSLESNCQQTVTMIGDNLKARINVISFVVCFYFQIIILFHFFFQLFLFIVPGMINSSEAHVIDIETHSSKSIFHDDAQKLIKSLANEKKNAVCFSRVIYNGNPAIDENKCIENVTARIITGIRHKKTMITINAQ